MTLTPIAKITFEIQEQPGWEGVRDWGLIVKAWADTVSPTIAQKTQPRSISREVLTIATHSSSLAHQLTFGRQAICRQLNDRLTAPVRDLRFIAVGYTSSGTNPTATDESLIRINSGSIVICPHCNSRAREGELFRWGVCQFCAMSLDIMGSNLRYKKRENVVMRIWGDEATMKSMDSSKVRLDHDFTDP
jgi:predicted nucleic acid-binding Zn ribbon protein